MLRPLLVGLVVLLLGTTTPLWVLGAPDAGAVRVASAPLISLDPLEASKADDLRLLGAVVEPLTRLDPTTGRAVPALARRWTTSDDGRIWTFHLDPAARWSDGAPVTAQQAADGLLAHRVHGSPFSDQLHGFVGIDTSDPLTLHLRLREPSAWLPELLAVPVFGPRRADQTWHDASRLVTNGPLRCHRHQARHTYDLRPNPSYQGPHQAQGPVRVRIVGDPATALRLYLDGQIDVLPSINADTAQALVAAGIPGLSRSIGWGTELYRIRYGSLTPGQVATLSAAIDREALVRDLLHGFGRPATGLVPGLSVPWPAGGETTPAEMDLLIPAGRPDRQRLAEHLADVWRRTTASKVRIVTVPAAELSQRERRGQFTMSRGSLVGDTPDPAGFLAAFTSGSGMNRTGWSDATYDALIRTAGATAGPEQAALLDAASARLVQAGVVIPLYHYETLCLARPGIRGAVAHPWDLVELHRLGRSD